MAPVREWDDPTNSGLRPNAEREQTRPRTRSKSPGPLRLRKAKQGDKRETRRTMEYDYIGTRGNTIRAYTPLRRGNGP